jgi:hypothetical protein
MPKPYLKSKRKEGGPLTPIQLQNRKRRRMLMYRMLYGMPTPKGTRPGEYVPPPGPPVFKPMPRPVSFTDQAFGAIMSLVALLPGMRRRRKEAELAEQQRSESMKAKGR